MSCSKSDNSNVKTETRKDDELGKFLCNVCRKRFTRSDLLNRHKRIHPADAVSGRTPISQSSVASNAHAKTAINVQTAAVSRLKGKQVNQSTENDAECAENDPATISVAPLDFSQDNYHQPGAGPPVLQQILAQTNASNPSSGTPAPQIITYQPEETMHPHMATAQERVSFGNGLDYEFLLGFQTGHVGTYDADISWAFDNFNAKSSSEYSTDYDIGMKRDRVKTLNHLLTCSRSHIHNITNSIRRDAT